jgi:hypothetical protein
VDVIMTGAVELESRLRRHKRSILPAAVEQMVAGAHAVLAASEPRVPVATGALQASGRVHPVEQTAKSASVEIGYGNGGQLRYAKVAHFASNPFRRGPRAGRAYVRHPIGLAEGWFLLRTSWSRAAEVKAAMNAAIDRVVRS